MLYLYICIIHLYMYICIAVLQYACVLLCLRVVLDSVWLVRCCDVGYGYVLTMCQKSLKLQKQYLFCHQ